MDELYEKILKEIFVKTGGRAENLEIAKVCQKLVNEEVDKRVSLILEKLEKFRGGTHYSGANNEFRTTFLGDWQDILQALEDKK